MHRKGLSVNRAFGIKVHNCNLQLKAIGAENFKLVNSTAQASRGVHKTASCKILVSRSSFTLSYLLEVTRARLGVAQNTGVGI